MSNSSITSSPIQPITPVLHAAPALPVENTSKPKTAKSRRRVNTAEKRATHNAVERMRRETLNGRFLDLAGMLPQLASTRRPSKSAIVNSSIAHLSGQRNQRLLAARELRTLLEERDALLVEVNEWRVREGIPPRESSGVSEAVEEVLKVEEETFGTFSGGFGEDGEEDEEQDEVAGNVSSNTMSTSNSNNGAESPVLVNNTIQPHSISMVNPVDLGNNINSAAATFFALPGFDMVQNVGSLGMTQGMSPALHMNNYYSPGAQSQSSNPVKLEALTPPGSNNSNSPYGHGGLTAQSPASDVADKVSSWAAEQLLSRIQQQQQHGHQVQPGQQPPAGVQAAAFHAQNHLLANQHHGQNPFTAALLANFSGGSPQGQQPAYMPQQQQQQPARSNSVNFGSFGMDETKAFNGFNQAAFPSYVPNQQSQLDAWREIALNHYRDAQVQQMGPSLGELRDAVRQGIMLGAGSTYAA